MFRGQREDWDLHPSAMRKGSLVEKCADNIRLDLQTMDLLRDEMKEQWKSYPETSFQRHFDLALRITVEKLLIWRFEDLAERVGLRIPLNNVALWGGGTRRDLHDELAANLNAPKGHLGFAPNEIVVALAQHHKIPTRLLDWTYRPMVAAFIAADEDTWFKDLPTYKETDAIVIWAVERTFAVRTDLEVVRQPGQISQIGFLRSQDGLFLTDTTADAKYLGSGNWQPYENELSKLVPINRVYKLTLPGDERGRLLVALEQKGISNAFLKPSFDNVADTVKSKCIDIFDLTAR